MRNFTKIRTLLARVLHHLCSPTAAALLTATFIVLVDNDKFWHEFVARVGLDSLADWRFVVAFGVIMVLLFNSVLALLAFRPIFKPVMVCILLMAAAVSYFADSYGVAIDKAMIRNILETNVQEAGELLTWALAWHLALYGLLPAVLIVLAPIRYPSWRRGLLLQAGSVAASLALIVALVAIDFKNLVLFGRENRNLQVYINPSYPLYALGKTVKSSNFAHAAEPLQIVADDAMRERHTKPTVVVLVVGETARAANVAWNGYGRETTPYTASRDMVNFSDVESCATDTADSVPCMFSALGRDRFSRGRAEHAENLLDVLQRTGVQVVWRDNDSGSKGVAERVVYEDFSKRQDARVCSDGNCYDEVLLEGLDELIRARRDDLLVVLHIKGSHGPSYYKRTPADRKVFTPECAQDNVQDCSRESIVNAYDNTIVYTDYVIGKIVDLLQAQNSATALLYVSDHGESLGENGIYLHGMPYALAPQEQTHVPMQFWASQEFVTEHRIDTAALMSKRDGQVSHDNIFHSMLGLFDVKTRLYRDDLDLFATHRHGGNSAKPSA